MFVHIRVWRVAGYGGEHPKALSCFEKPSFSFFITVSCDGFVMLTQRREDKLMDMLRASVFAIASVAERLKSVHG